jgi:hypothetical protein
MLTTCQLGSSGIHSFSITQVSQLIFNICLVVISLGLVCLMVCCVLDHVTWDEIAAQKPLVQRFLTQNNTRLLKMEW